jgi:ABC-type lipoprotein export system ATPase subunit
MEILLNQIMPSPLSSIEHRAESIWGNFIELKKGKHILLNASSGKGKSTFTNTIIGLRNDYEGTVTFGGQDIKTFTPDDWTSIRQTKISVIYQDLQLFNDLTVAENLILKNNLTNLFSEKEMLEMLEKLGIESKWNQKCGLLSMGQQQRVAIVRSLLQPFEWLIMDEPFSHLDNENAMLSLEMIDKRCKDLNAGFVLTSLGDRYGYEYDQELKL